MSIAFQEAEKAFQENEVPIGAIIVLQEKFIAKAHNQSVLLKDPTAHAEMLAITQACNYLQSKYLNKAILYCTVEPCLMCFGAIINAQIETLIYGANEPKTGFTNFIASKNIKLKIESGIMEIEAKKMMTSFFQTLR